MTAIPIRCTAFCLLVCLLLLIPGATVEADEDTWSVVVTPQLWVTHIASNGFSAPGGNFGVVLINPFDRTTAFTNIFRSRSSTHVGAISPEPGIQISARKQRWTLAGSLFSAGDADAKVVEAVLEQSLASPVGVMEMRVAAVDDNVAR